MWNKFRTWTSAQGGSINDTARAVNYYQQLGGIGVRP